MTKRDEFIKKQMAKHGFTRAEAVEMWNHLEYADDDEWAERLAAMAWLRQAAAQADMSVEEFQKQLLAGLEGKERGNA
jgi:hypothetical protein